MKTSKISYTLCFKLLYVQGNYHYYHVDIIIHTCRIVGKFGGGGKFGKMTRFKHWQKKVWQINGSANRLLIVSINLDGFSLANHG